MAGDVPHSASPRDMGPMWRAISQPSDNNTAAIKLFQEHLLLKFNFTMGEVSRRGFVDVSEQALLKVSKYLGRIS